MAGLIVFGWISFTRMGIGLLPDVDFPVIQVQVTLEGAAPEIMETEVADVIEDAVMGVTGVRNVTSQSFQGRTMIMLELDLSHDIDVALQEVETKIASVQRNLPRGIDPPNYLKINPEEQPFMWLAVSGGKSPTRTHDLCPRLRQRPVHHGQRRGQRAPRRLRGTQSPRLAQPGRHGQIRNHGRRHRSHDSGPARGNPGRNHQRHRASRS